MSARREKKVANINVHLAERTELRVRRLAEASGQSASEYLHTVIIEHLKAKELEYSVLHGIFAVDGSDSSQECA